MTDYKTVWKSPVRLGIAIGVTITFIGIMLDSSSLSSQICVAGLAIVAITIVLFSDVTISC